MAAYSFQARFVPAIECGAKRHTIRKARRGHAKVGGPITLQTGSRFKPSRLGVSVCTRLAWISLDFTNGVVKRLWDERAREPAFGIPGFPGVNWAATHRLVGLPGLNHFAQSDGFQDWDDMARFWSKSHATEVFEGVLIEWGEIA